MSIFKLMKVKARVEIRKLNKMKIYKDFGVGLRLIIKI